MCEKYNANVIVKITSMVYIISSYFLFDNKQGNTF